MIRRVIMFIAIWMLAVVPLATAHAFPHVHAAVPADGTGLHDHGEAHSHTPAGPDHGHSSESEQIQCCTTSSHCAGFVFRSDVWKVANVDWSLKVDVPTSDRPIFGLKPEAETPPPRS